jgi:hypothetical protein
MLIKCAFVGHKNFDTLYLFVLKNTETQFQNRNVRKMDLECVCPQSDSSEIWNGFLRLGVEYDSGANLALYELGVALCTTRLNFNNSQHRQ